MKALIEAAIHRARASILLLILIVAGGLVAFQTLPREANPDVTIPYIYVSVTLDGVSPEDAERLLVRPLEQELRSLEGIKEMTSFSAEGHASVLLEFDAGFDPDLALQDVRDKVDTVKSDLPTEADEPSVDEINISEFPVLTLGLSGPIAPQRMVYIAREMRDRIEAIPEVLEVDIGGDREDLLEITVDPQVLAGYGVDYSTLYSLVSSNNRLVAAGSIDTGSGRLTLKVPGVISDLDDLMSMPVKVDGDSVVTFNEVASVRRTFKDPTGFARLNGQPALVLEVSKRAGANIVETIDQVKALLAEAQPLLPPGLEITIITDQSIEVQNLLTDLLNNVLTAVILVLLVMLLAMGPRPALLVGLTIPGAFLAGLLMIQLLGFTLNIIVLFSLILVAGMLVDGAIVVSELADRNREQGLNPPDAWSRAAIRMSWPVIASTATTLMVFLPLLFWPGIVGEFMKYLPATVIVCLLASLAMALVFLPVLGSIAGGAGATRPPRQNSLSRRYRAFLAALLKRPALTLLASLVVMTLVYITYARFNQGVEFFPDTEPESALVLVHARGDLSVYERDQLVQRVEQRLTGMPEIEALYARSQVSADSQQQEDVIGVLQFQFIDWEQRRPANLILQDMQRRTADLAGLKLEFRKQENGPTEGKPVQLHFVSNDSAASSRAVDQVRATMQQLGGFVDIEDDRTLPGIEWRLNVDREAAARFGADVASIGNAIQLVTQGLLLTTYRPADADDEVDIRVRLPRDKRTLDQLRQLTLNTSRGQVPMSLFVQMETAQKTGVINHRDGSRTLTLEADLAEGYQLDERLAALAEAVEGLPQGVELDVAGEQEDQQEAATFLVAAFLVALLLMTLILVVQFNSFYQTLLVLSAIVFSTAGVLIGLLVNQQSFGIVMVGMGVIALAGIVVNNNIVLIDTYNQHLKEGYAPFEAALETGCLRLRPVLLTALTTVLGLMPMVLGVNVNLLEPSLGIGAPSTQWWTQLSSAIAGGLAFATFLTLLLTPCMLVLGAKTSAWLTSLRHAI
ncbi:efflux RND transporter permease subunit [Marinobacterium sp. YM272]|uniref:efflux RND transporter permease subunit n=1 Tax=Marinobacterium sp. YM272 TaxID=3421654 RepID=UPI003D7F258E